MNGSRPHLLSEDRHEYERILDDALHTASERPELASIGERLSAEQLRTMALGAQALLTAAAAAEYDHYVKVREERRYAVLPPAAPAPSTRPRTGTHPAATDRAGTGLGRRIGAAVLGAGQPGGRRISNAVAAPRWAGMSYSRRLLAALLGLRVRPEVPPAAGVRSPRPPEPPTAARTRPTSSEAQALETNEATGAGAVAAFAILAPVLSGTAAALSFLIGLVLEMLSAESGSGRAMFSAGWLFVALAVAAVAVCVVGLVVTALRNSQGQPMPEDARDREPSEDEVARAREAWRHALLERGIMPFLRDALAAPTLPGSDVSSRAPTPGRIPDLRYTRPDFTSPDFSPNPAPDNLPSYTRPDYAGPEHKPE
ncbi:hypothetical protein [Streptomyces sp. NBC_01443]|uniref:hypothetical protein n=1 Tax=Streptomyces sp. NBC_01443 TaxID=2903868 RepID=UPI00225B5B24|nr:hypothetical protein [Streptomyces sp. NBC_01443]MCX4632734.1 hypothetical protein [Streptomyces sp. NBC_01443]